MLNPMISLITLALALFIMTLIAYTAALVWVYRRRPSSRIYVLLIAGLAIYLAGWIVVLVDAVQSASVDVGSLPVPGRLHFQRF